MDKKFRYIVLLLVSMICSLQGMAQTATQSTAQTEDLDTIYFYTTWEQMLTFRPEAYLVNPYCDVVTPYEVYIETFDDNINEMIEEKYIAVSQGDSIWLLNSEYLKKNFKGDVKAHQGFVPVYFNEKTAFITSYAPPSVKDILFGNNEDGVTSYNVNYYYIDFLKQRVTRVTHEYLSQLLEDYRDLKMRFEGMKDYKKQYIIEDYFFKYIDRASEDFMHPDILDLTQ